MLFYYKNGLYPSYLKAGNAAQYILPIAQHFCKGRGVDVGGGKWPFPGAINVDLQTGVDLNEKYVLSADKLDYIFSSHCLEHLHDPVGALGNWWHYLRPGGCVFLYLPHPDMEYWLPQNNRKHLHSWTPEQMWKLLHDLGYHSIQVSQRDMFWSFAAVGFKPPAPVEE